MVVAGLALAVVGFGLLFNLGDSAGWLAVRGRPLPAWVTWPWGTSATYYRGMGALLVLMGALFLGAGFRA